ncbi:hypothetical protein ABEF93_006132 [Exophiala dermatitidis]
MTHTLTTSEFHRSHHHFLRKVHAHYRTESHLSMALRPSEFTFTEDRLRDIWRDPENLRRRSQYENYGLVDHESEHGLPDQSIIARAIEILGQQPVTSPSILEALPSGKIPGSGYMLPSHGAVVTGHVVPDPVWDRLVVTNFVNTSVLRLVLCIAQAQLSREYGPASIVRLLNGTIQLLRVSLDLATGSRTSDEKWTVVCAFLWTSWSRLLLLLLGPMMGRQLEGFDYNVRGLGSIRLLDVVPEIVDCRRRLQQRELQATPYLCAWAYRNLVDDRACISTDLRYFHQVYHACFGTRPAICNQGANQCDGLSSISCARFEHTPVHNQSSHASGCKGDCQRLFWIRESFVAVSGPKAVDLAATNAMGLRYCQSTEDTLTISHVWSHGQGGRPDAGGEEGTGFNSCLHRRYSALASSLGCSSYWIDTAAIPSEKALRRECITNINQIFSTSKTTVVCDRDIMSVDISRITVEACEQILAALLVCDWNMRAWTLLEAVTGRRSLHLLCRDDKLISIKEVLQTVYTSGRIDLVIPYMMRSYLLPPDDITDIELFDGGGSVATEEDCQLAEGFISIGEAAVLLSHRHATRDDDDLIIWNILIGDDGSYDAAEMWMRQVGKRIPSGALVSSAPRLQNVPGFHWAPSRPTVSRRTKGISPHDKTFPALDSVDSKDGYITAQGLRAKWLTFKFDTARLTHRKDTHLDVFTLKTLAKVAGRYLELLPWGSLLQVCPARGPANVPITYQGSSNHLLVVCGSPDGEHWEWKGVYEWDRHVQLPEFTIEDILLV